MRFYRNAQMVVGVVSYVSYDSTFDSCHRYQTDQGEVTEDRILEAR